MSLGGMYHVRYSSEIPDYVILHSKKVNVLALHSMRKNFTFYAYYISFFYSMFFIS
jgi:hypothetical protein